MKISVTPARVCALIACLAFALGFFRVADWGMTQMRWALLGWFSLAAGILYLATTVRPQGGPDAPGAVQPGHPFVERDPGPGGASLLCVSDRPGKVLPPFLVVDPALPTTVPGLASNPPGVAGSL